MSGETKRQIEHMLPVGFAFLLRYLTLWQMVLCCMAAAVYGIFISGRINRAGVREDEAARGYSVGKISYALTVLALILIFRNRLHGAAGAWAMLSVGDAASNLAGRAWGKKRIPWSDSKTWVGSIAFVFSSWVMSAVLVLWTAAGTGAILPGLPVVAGACLAAAVAGGVVETLPLVVNDNVTSPLAAAFVLAAFI